MVSLSRLELDAHEQFVDNCGHQMTIRMYGERTRAGLRFNLEDLYEVFQRQHHCDPNGMSIDTVRVTETREMVRVLDMWDFLSLVSTAQRRGNENAKTIFAWVVDTVFGAQFGDATASVPQSMHAMGVGTSLPAEFGQRVSGAYAFTFLRGSADLCGLFPSLGRKIDELGLGADSEWYVGKSGHTDNMRRRLGEHKNALNIHESFCIQHGCFWNTTNKKLASATETQIQNDVLGDFKVTLDGYDFDELFVMTPALIGDPLRVEGQSIANEIVAKALDTSEAKMLRAGHKHRDEMDALREKNDALKEKYTIDLETSREKHASEVDALRAENAKLVANTAALNALRLIVPPKTLAKFNAIIPPVNPSTHP
jgi:hypothetical protein